MTSKLRARLSRLLAPLCTGALLLSFALASCKVPDFEFADSGSTPGVAGDGSTPSQTVPHCRNGELDGSLGESDFDCGRGCSPCSAGKHCTDGADCADELICHEGTCIGTGCMNGAREGTETDVDCGGGSCKACISGKSCALGTDCEDGVCTRGTCRDAACDDGAKNGNETATDCGGDCPPCGVDAPCRGAQDCDSGVCDSGKCLAPACDDNVKNGKESAKDCGGDCVPCLVDEACRVGTDCVSGECNDRICGTECPDGFANCDKQNANGCELNVRADPLNCGACGNVCDLPHATSECSAGECRIVANGCDPGYLDCNGDPADGCEVDPKTNAANCGACDKVCPDVNGTPSCKAGACQIKCDDGFDDCDDSRDNGCEVDLKTDVNNCDGCTKKCAAPVGFSAYCKDRACGQTQCPAGLGDCNGDPADPGGACETTLSNDVNNCGACGNKCQNIDPNSNFSCVAGVCKVTGCKGSWADCGGDTRCETDTSTSTTHCGGCNKGCTIANGAPKCDAGSCQVKSCNGTFRDCDGDPKTGCEINVATNAGNCSACNNDCNAKYPHASSTCSASSCSAPSCNAGYDDCSGGIADGCETDTSGDPLNCGGCNNTCATGSSAHVSSNSCVSGQCDPKCTGTFLTCDGDRKNGCEADITSDASNCGGCNLSCDKSAAAHVVDNVCSARVCEPDCVGAFRDCDSNGNNGCEVDTASSRTNCGGCNLVCDTSSAAHVTSNSCTGGNCKPVCSGTYGDCDNNHLNGCEKDTSTDKNNCGGCKVVCGTQHASATTCSAGTCDPTCSAGWGKCATPEQGCVTPLGTTTDCTKCGDACASPTIFCDPAGCVDHRDIVVVNSGSASVGSNSTSHAINGWSGSGTPAAQITVNHALATAQGNNRMVLVGVTATDNFTNPENIKVTYGPSQTPMLVAFEQLDSAKHIYAGIYYLLDAALPSSPGTNAVVASFGPVNTWGHGGVDVVELKNTMQVAPIASGGAQGNLSCGASSPRAATVTFSQAGSLVYGVMGARGATGATLSGAGSGGLVETWNQQQSSPDKLRAAAGYVIADSDRTLTWNVANCFYSATAAVAIKRLTWK